MPRLHNADSYHIQVCSLLKPPGGGALRVLGICQQPQPAQQPPLLGPAPLQLYVYAAATAGPWARQSRGAGPQQSSAYATSLHAIGGGTY